MATSEPASKAHEPVVWDLSDVLPGTSGPAFEAVRDELETKVDALEGARSNLDAIEDPDEVHRLFDLVGEVSELASRLSGYGSLAFSTDTSDQQVKAFLARMDELTTDVSNRIRFLSLWWKNLPDDRARGLLPEDPEVRYHLERVRAFAPYTLSEAEERVVAIKDDTGATAMDRLRDILTSGYRFTDPKTGEEVTQSDLTRRAYDPDPEVRKGAYDELWRVYETHESSLSFLYQTVVQDWANEHAKLRGYERPIAPRNLANDVPGEVVEALLDACRENRQVFQRYFTWKGNELGLEPMSRYHIYAPLEAESLDVPYEEGRATVLDVFGAFDPRVREAAERVFAEDHIHVYPDDAKRGGAYCATINHDLTPYVFLNYTDDDRSVSTLAHEMGHAIHGMMAEERHPLVAHPPLPLAETASVFSEMLLHDRLMEKADDATRRGLLSDKLGEIYATVMRQAYFARFEIEAHDAIAQGATADDLHEIYLANLREQFGPVEVPDDFRREWTYIPHFYHSPFYVYAYSFGMLLSLALYGAYKEGREGFADDYLALLALGGSRSPRDAVLDTVGLDIADPAFWQRGFTVIEGMMEELEGL